MRLGLAVLCVLLAVGGSASAESGGDPAVGYWEADAVRRVWTRLEARDCAAAVNELNGGLTRNYAVVMVMAGAMYQDGLCLKQNQERAISMFERAYASGRKQQAGGRLTALHAAQGPAQDKAAALWWAQRSGQSITRNCLGREVSLEDADGFVKALSALPAPLLDACTYVAGVMGVIQGDLEFPSRAASFGMKGSVELEFLPAEARFVIRGTNNDVIQMGGVVDGDVVRDDRPAMRNEFVKYMSTLTQQALKQFPKPSQVPVAWRFTTTYNFSYQY